MGTLVLRLLVCAEADKTQRRLSGRDCSLRSVPKQLLVLRRVVTGVSLQCQYTVYDPSKHGLYGTGGSAYCDLKQPPVVDAVRSSLYNGQHVSRSARSAQTFASKNLTTLLILLLGDLLCAQELFGMLPVFFVTSIKRSSRNRNRHRRHHHHHCHCRIQYHCC